MLETIVRESEQPAKLRKPGDGPLREPPTEQYGAFGLRPREIHFPRPVPRPVPRPIPRFQGSRFLIWKQDPSVSELGMRISYIPGLVLNGPRDLRITTELPGTTPVSRDASGDFIFPSGTPELDSAHTYAVVRQTLTMYERVRDGARIPWAWSRGRNTDALTVFPRAGVAANAYYSRGQKALRFFHFTPQGAPGPLYTCRSLDIVAHEAGHAILDGLKPGWLGIGNPPQTGGIHESFGDLSSVFLALSQLDQVEAIVALTKADLHEKNFLSAVAEQFGEALGRPTGLRNADNNLKLSQVSNEVHAISQVFTGAIYDVLADIFIHEKNRQIRSRDPARVLLEVAARLCELVFKAILEAPAVGATFTDVANKMLTISRDRGDPPIYRTFIRRRFVQREIVVSPVPLAAAVCGKDLEDPKFVDIKNEPPLEPFDHESCHAEAGQDRSGCCGTMQLPEYCFGDEKSLRAGKPIVDEDLLADEIKELEEAFK